MKPGPPSAFARLHLFVAISLGTWLCLGYLAGCEDRAPVGSLHDDLSFPRDAGDLWHLGPADDQGSPTDTLTDHPPELDGSGDPDEPLEDGNRCTQDDDCDCSGGHCEGGECICPEPCEGPPRLYPVNGPTSGGTLIRIEGMEFIIGALDWWAMVGEGPLLHAVWEIDSSGPCSLPFLTPPLAQGSYPVVVYYGEPGEPRPDTNEVGTFTTQETGELIGSGPCQSETDCTDPIETCDLGLMRCVVDLCTSLHCSRSWTPGVCDPLFGCVPEENQCRRASDCRLIYSSCGCQAVHRSDPRVSISSCDLGGCEQCTTNRCDLLSVQAACVDRHCTERIGTQ